MKPLEFPCPLFESRCPKSGLWVREYAPPAPRMLLKGRARIQVIDRHTKEVVEDRGWQPNLILDQGLDKIATVQPTECFRYCAAGTGNTPTEADSTGIATASQSGTTVTLSTTWAEVAVNRLIRWDTGEEAKIVSGSGTSWTVDRSQTVASGDFRVFRVEQTGLASEVTSPAGAGRTQTYLTGTGNCETVRTGSRFDSKRTFDFLSPSSNTNYAEVGFSDIGTQAPNLFSRVLIAGGAVSVTTSQQLRVIYELRITYAPTTPLSKSASITGWPVSPATNTNGSEQLNDAAVSNVLTSGGTSLFNGAFAANEPAGGGHIFISTDSAAHPSWPTGISRTGAVRTFKVLDTNTYTNGSFVLDKSGEFAVGEANRNDWRGIGFGHGAPNNSFPDQNGCIGIYFLFDQAQTKANTHKLRLTFRFSWNRDLS